MEAEGQGNKRAEEKPENLSEAAWQRLEGLNARFETELSYADALLAEEPPSSRIVMVLANSTELRRLAILQRFIERAYYLRLYGPQEGLQISDNLIAWTKSDPSPLVAVIRRRAMMERGNFLRILGDPTAAYAALEEAARELEAIDDPLELARYQELLGSLEANCANYEAAAYLSRKALAKVRRWGDSHTLQRVLTGTGMVEILNGNYEAAENLLDESMRIGEADSIFLRYAATNRILAYFDSGNPHRAYKALLRVRGNLGDSWMQGFPERTQMRQVWLEGQILAALHCDDDAIGRFKRAREFFIRSGHGFEVGCISVDLAASYAAQDRLAEARSELAFALPFCSEERPLNRYAREGVLLLHGALQRQGRLQADQVRAVTFHLDSIHRAPLQTFRQPPFAGLQL